MDQPVKTAKVRIVRPCRVRERENSEIKEYKKGSTLEMEANRAAELVASGKAEFHTASEEKPEKSK